MVTFHKLFRLVLGWAYEALCFSLRLADMCTSPEGVGAITDLKAHWNASDKKAGPCIGCAHNPAFHY